MSRIILHLDLDSFYASLEELRNKEIIGKPIVICVFSGRSEDSGAVSTANYKARELGIKSGMPISRAKLLAKDKDVVFLPIDKEYYSIASQRIMELLEEEGDTIQQVSIDEAYLDITEKSDGSWENAKKIAEEIKNKIREKENLICSIGIGPNKLVAKIASKHKKPDGLTIIKDSDVKEFFENLPLSKLHGIGNKTIEPLNQLGIKSVKDLANWNLQFLENSFGTNKAKKLQDIARGIDDSLVEQRDKQQISRLGTLKEDTDSIEIIFDKMKELLVDLSKKIQQDRVLFRTISIITIDSYLKMQTRSETITETDNFEKIIPIFRSLIEKFLQENTGIKLRRIGVRVSNLVYKKQQKTLIDF